MSEGKFSQPRPHRDEERQIEESFRQLTEEKHRRKKVYTAEDDIGKATRNVYNQKVPLAEEHAGRFERNARSSDTVRSTPGQSYAPPQSREAYAARTQQPYVPQTQQTYSTQPHQPHAPQSQQPYSAQARQSYAASSRQTPQHTVSQHPVYPAEEPDILFEDAYNAPEPVFPEVPAFPEEAYPEEEPDFIDKLLNLGNTFKRYQTPIILGLCLSAVLLIAVFVSLFFTGGKDASAGDTILPNVYIADIPVGGMTKNEAIAAVRKATSDTYTTMDMVIDLSGTQIRLSPKDTKANLDAKAAVEAAFEYGRAGSKAQQELLLQNAMTEEHIIAALPYLNLNVDYIRDALMTYAENTGSTLTQTSYGLEGSEPALSADKFNEKAPTQTLVIIMGTPGIGFDAKDVYEKVLDAYSLHRFLVEVENVEAVTEPDPIDLKKIYEEFYIKPVNASVNLQNYKTEAGSYGYGFDLEAAQKLVDKAQPGEVLRIPMEYIAPDILDNDAFFKDTLGSHQTRSTGNDDRNRNLQLACNAIDGTVLNPGESLSFRSLMNKVSGFRTAPEDTGREEVEQGGVTQVASTLYYAALMSDLNIASRNPHAYLPSFIDYGLDATSDLSITNSTGYPIQINASYSGGYVKVEIAGTEERDYYIMLESSISSSTAPTTVYEEFPYDNEEGYEDGDVIEEGSNGYLVKSYKIKYNRKTGNELSRDFITNSQYKAVDRIIARVEEPPETEPPTLPPTEPPTEAPTEPPTQPPTEEATEPPTAPSTEATVPSSDWEEEQYSQEEQPFERTWPRFPFGSGRW